MWNWDPETLPGLPSLNLMIQTPSSQVGRSRRAVARISVGLIALFVFGGSLRAQDDPGGPRVLTLTEAIGLALERNVALQRSGVTIEIRRNEVEARRGDYQPNLIATASDSLRYSGNGFENVWDEGEWSNSLSAALISSITLYNGGENAASLARARADLEASSLDYDRDHQTLLFQVVANYLEAVLRLKEIAIQREELASRRENLDWIRTDFENGIRIRSDVLRQQAQVAESVRLLAEAHRNYQTSLYSLKDLLLLDPSSEINCSIPPENWTAAETLSDPDREASLRAAVSRVDLEAQRARIVAAQEDIRVARSGRRPTLTASAGLRSGYNSRGSGGFGDQFGRYRPEVSGGLAVALPIFDRKRTSTNLIRSKLLLRQEELFLEDLMQIAGIDLLQAVLDFNTSKIRLAASQDQLAASEAALEAEQVRYEAGAATLLDVNSLRTQRVDAAVKVEESRFALFVTRLGVTYQDGTINSFLLEKLQTPIPGLTQP